MFLHASDPCTLRFDAQNDASFWCELLEQEGVEMIKGCVMLGD